MRCTHAFIDRPVLATVVSAFITLIGLGALFVLPVAQYPEIVPPTVQVTTNYPGGSADVVAQTVATPLDQEINGVESRVGIDPCKSGMRSMNMPPSLLHHRVPHKEFST